MKLSGILIKANEVTANGNIFTEESLKKLAENDKRFIYNSKTKCLEFKGELKEVKFEQKVIY